MNETSDEEKILSKTERSPRKKKKRKSRKKKIEHSDEDDCNQTESVKPMIQNEKSKNSPSKANRRSLKNIFKKTSDFNKLSNDVMQRSYDEDSKLQDQPKTPKFFHYDPVLQPRSRLGQMTLKDAMREKHSRTDQSPTKSFLLYNDSCGSSSSLPDINDHVTEYDRSRVPQRKSRSKSAEMHRRPRRSKEKMSPHEQSSPVVVTSSANSKDTFHSARQMDRGRTLEKTHRKNRSRSREFIDSEKKRDTFSAFMNLSHTSPAFGSPNLQRKRSPVKSSCKNSEQCGGPEIDIFQNVECDIDQKDYTQSLKGDISSSTNLNCLDTKPYSSDLIKPMSQVANDNAVNKDTNTMIEDSLKKGKIEKRLDRRSYKSPRRFCGRSISRERRKSGRSIHDSEKSVEVVHKATEHNDECRTTVKSEIETKDTQTETEGPMCNLLSRSIQTSMNLLDITNDVKDGNEKQDKETAMTGVPVILEPTESAIDDNKTKTLVHNDQGERASASSATSSSEEFKTPKQSPLPERRSLELLNTDASGSPESKAEDINERKKSKLSFLAVVALKRKLARQRKKKKPKMSNSDKKQTKADDITPYEKTDDPPDVIEKNETKDKSDDKYMTSIYFENETGFNIGNLSYLPETDILDAEEIKKDISISDKKLSFDIIEPVATDDSIETAYAHRTLAKRRQSEVFREKRKKALSLCKKFVAFLFSHIGLCSLMVAYAILGGFIFKALEGPFEVETKLNVYNERETTKNEILKLATEMILEKWSRNDTAVAIDKLLHKFQTQVYIATDVNGFNNAQEDNLETEEQWSFASSLLFAITVMTTIGYGHVAPKTDYGRIVTIGYAVFGIPLTLLCLTNIGDLMATGFRMLYAKVCCGICCLLFTPKRRRIPDPEKALEGGSIEYQEGKETVKSPEVVNVPTSVCILLMTSYILLGTLLFSIWEKWDGVTGAYFSFITLSTIGFGDVVPGTAMNQWENEEKLVLCAMYLVFGLSLIAMCFNLVQEDVKNKCRWLGAKIGIIDRTK